MAKGYWIALITVKDPEKYKDYAAIPAALKKFGGKFIVRGGKYETRKGREHKRHVVIEFESLPPPRPATTDPNKRSP
jgi:uncharacterized protein (DUF1330 family)